jgi:hypothetical protein
MAARAIGFDFFEPSLSVPDRPNDLSARHVRRFVWMTNWVLEDGYVRSPASGTKVEVV